MWWRGGVEFSVKGKSERVQLLACILQTFKVQVALFRITNNLRDFFTVLNSQEFYDKSEQIRLS